MKIDLAKYPKKEGNGPQCCPSPSPDKPSYPEFCLRDEQYDAFMEAAGNPDIDDVLSIGDGVQVRIKGLRNDEYGRSVDLCVLSMENISNDGKESEDEEEGEEETPRSRLKKKVAAKSEEPSPKSKLKEAVKY